MKLILFILLFRNNERQGDLRDNEFLEFYYFLEFLSFLKLNVIVCVLYIKEK